MRATTTILNQRTAKPPPGHVRLSRARPTRLEASEWLSQSRKYTQYNTPRMIHGNTLSRRT